MHKLEQTLDSREVADMIDKAHSELLKDMRRYISQFNEGNLPFVDFFRESTYEDSKGETRPCYRITKKGCEFIAHKLTGTKGTVFTARYINRFHEMESILSEQKQEVAPVQPEQIGQITKECADLREEINNLKADMRRINRIQMIPYGSSHTYKAEIIRMLEELWEEEGKDKKFLCQIYTIIKTYTKRKYQYNYLTHNMN